jgi:hypothetical protein
MANAGGEGDRNQIEGRDDKTKRKKSVQDEDGNGHRPNSGK